jgi:hypothetical protein
LGNEVAKIDITSLSLVGEKMNTLASRLSMNKLAFTWKKQGRDAEDVGLMRE